MKIPPPNAQATDKCRELTRQIIALLGYTLDVNIHRHCADDPFSLFAFKDPHQDEAFTELPNGSLTLCQAVAMLKELRQELEFTDDYSLGWNRNHPVEIEDVYDLKQTLRALLAAVKEKK
jgi:hypothetical protein